MGFSLDHWRAPAGPETLRNILKLDTGPLEGMRPVLSIGICLSGNPVSWKRMRLDPRHRNARGIPRSFEDAGAREARRRIAETLAIAAAGLPRALHPFAPCSYTLWSLSGHFQCETFHRRDLDRMTSLAMDAATGVVYEDDSQVRAFLDIRYSPGAARKTGWTDLTFTCIGVDPRATRSRRTTNRKPR